MSISTRLLVVVVLLSIVASTVPRSALGQGAAFISSGTPYFPTLRADKTEDVRFTLRNLDVAIALHGHMTLPTRPEFKLMSPDTFTVLPNRTDTFTVRFAPLDSGHFIDSINFVTDGHSYSPSETQAIILDGHALRADDTAPRMYVITTKTQVTSDSEGIVSVEFKNLADTLRDLFGYVSKPRNSYFTLLGDSTFSVHQNHIDTLSYRFDPPGVGVYTDTVYLHTNSNTPLYRVALTGTSLAPLTIGLSDSAIDFGSVALGRDSIAYPSFTNSTPRQSLLTARWTYPAPPFSVEPVIEGLDTLLQFDSRTLLVHFTPIAAGHYKDSIVLRTNATLPSYKRKVIYLTGNSFVSGVRRPEAGSAQLRISPNPARTFVRVELPAVYHSAEATLVNEAGEVVRRFGIVTTDADLDLRGLASGTYLLRLRLADQTLTRHVVLR